MNQKKLVVDQDQKKYPKEVTTTLAHESGHYKYKRTYTPPDGLTKEQFVEANVRDHLADEGEAVLYNIEVRQEIIDNGGPKIGVAGAGFRIMKIYKEYLNSNDRQKARDEIGKIIGDLHPSTDPSKTYREYYAPFYEQYYDAWKAKQGK